MSKTMPTRSRRTRPRRHDAQPHSAATSQSAARRGRRCTMRELGCGRPSSSPTLPPHPDDGILRRPISPRNFGRAAARCRRSSPPRRTAPAPRRGRGRRGAAARSSGCPSPTRSPGARQHDAGRPRDRSRSPTVDRPAPSAGWRGRAAPARIAGHVARSRGAEQTSRAAPPAAARVVDDARVAALPLDHARERLQRPAGRDGRLDRARPPPRSSRSTPPRTSIRAASRDDRRRPGRPARRPSACRGTRRSRGVADRRSRAARPCR